MSICHKAWLFDYDSFDAEFADLLYEALESDDIGPVAAFIDRHHALMTDFGSEERLLADWASGLESADVQSLADLAMTKYYDVRAENGLAHGFDALSAYLETVGALRGDADALLYGYLFGPEGRRLDPGLMGTGLVSRREACRLLAVLEAVEMPPIPEPDSDAYADCLYKPDTAGEVQESFDRIADLYREARSRGRGILFTDFNDRGVGHL
jgi:hypothetical protein